MQPLSPLQQARDQAIISGCLAQAMAASGTQAFLAAAAVPMAPGPHDDLVQQARAMREEARCQNDRAREMLKTNAEIVCSARRVWRPATATPSPQQGSATVPAPGA